MKGKGFVCIVCRGFFKPRRRVIWFGGDLGTCNAMKDVVGEPTNYSKKAVLSHVKGGSGSRRPSKKENKRVRSVRRKFLQTL